MSLIAELKRRNVFRVVIFYAVASWLILQIGDVLFEALAVPEWSLRLVLGVLVLGLPVVLMFSWIYEVTPEGVKKQTEVDREQSITHVTGRKLDLMTIGVVVLAVGVLLVDRFVLESRVPAPAEETAAAPEAVSPAAPSVAQSTDADSPADRKSIAVLPFANFSDDPDNAFFASGVHEDILTHLAKIKDLRVISRTTMEQFSEERPPIAEIANRLGVATVVEGSVRRAGDRVRVTAQLIDAATDEHLWAESYDRNLDDVFAIQSDIARQIATALQATLTDQEQALLEDAPTDDMAAYDLYLRAREILNRSEYSQRKFIEAEPLLKRAVELDPEFALAHAKLVDVHGQAVWLGWDSSEERKQAALEAAQRALELDPDLPQARAALGEYYYRIKIDFDRAVVELEAARDSLPNDSEILHALGMTYRRLDRWQESLAAFEEAVALDPANGSMLFGLTDTLNMVRRYDETIRRVNPALAEDPDDTGLAVQKAWALLSGYGDLAGARNVIADVPATDSPQYVILKLTLAAYSRDYEQVLEVLDAPMSRSLMGNAGWEGFIHTYFGFAYLGRGQADRARAAFEAGVDEVERAAERLGPGTSWELYLDASKVTNLSYLGRHDEALAIAEKALTRDYNSVDQTYLQTTYVQALARAGRIEAAIDLLQEVISTPVGPGPGDLALNPTFDPLRDHPRFQALIPDGLGPRIGVDRRGEI